MSLTFTSPQPDHKLLENTLFSKTIYLLESGCQDEIWILLCPSVLREFRFVIPFHQIALER